MNAVSPLDRLNFDLGEGTSLYLDTETFSPVPITHGTYRYAEEAEIMLVVWAWDEGPVTCWDLTAGDATLGDVQALIDMAREVVIHKSDFDRNVLRENGVNIPIHKITDTMVQALSHGLPGGLDKLCAILGVPQELAKLKSGQRGIQLFCKPQPKGRKIARATRLTHPVEWEEFKEYAIRDIPSMREVRKRLPRWNFDGPLSNRARDELELWWLDQEINDRGMCVDTELAEAAVRAAAEAQKRLGKQIQELTDDAIQSATQRAKVLAFLSEAYGFETPDLKGSTVEKLLEDADLSPEVRDMLEIREEAAATSPGKYKALLRGVSSDGRLRGTLQFCGAARTGRDGGRLFQPQNLPRPTLKQADIDHGIQAMKQGVEDLLYPDRSVYTRDAKGKRKIKVGSVMDLCTSAVRGSIIAAPGHKLVVADLSNIEGRVLAWLAGEQWKLDAFKAFDTLIPGEVDAKGEPKRLGHDLYKVTAGNILGKPPEDVTDDERQVSGKVPELACLGPDTQVLTSSGIKAIVEVALDDLLWDGEQWVEHEGLIARGMKSVLHVAGIEMTHDHLVLCGGQWLEAQTVVSNPSFLNRALEIGSASLSSLALNESPQAACSAFASSAHAAPILTSSPSRTFAPGVQLAATLAPRKRPEPTSRSGSATKTSSPISRTDSASASAYRPPSIVAIIRAILGGRTMAAEGSRFMAPGARIARSSSATSSRFRVGTTHLWKWTGRTSTRATSLEICASSRNARTTPIVEQSASCRPVSTSLRPVYDIANAGPRNRFTILAPDGRALIVHNCGYQGALGAFKTMAALYNVNLSDDEVMSIVKGWRAKHPNTVKLWYGLEDACKNAVWMPGTTQRIGHLAVQRDDAWLRIRLPSGRYLCYAGVECDDNGKLSYLGVNQYTRRWERIKTYGGKLVENCDQAASRDILFHGLRLAEAAGYRTILRVHDELVCEVPDEPRFTAEGLAALMATNPVWAPGLPLAAAGYETYRYRKA